MNAWIVVNGLVVNAKWFLAFNPGFWAEMEHRNRLWEAAWARRTAKVEAAKAAA